MSEAPVSTPKVAKGSVKLPGLGPVPKKWFLIVGGGSVVVIAYVLWRKRQEGPAAPAADTAGGTLEGQPCVDENGLPGVYDASGVCQVSNSAMGGYFAGSGAGGVSGTTPPVPGTGGFTTNGQWTQQAEADMSNTGVDPGVLAVALGAYIAGSPVTAAQHSLIDQAIAFEGYPPVAGASGYPPAVKAQPITPPPTTTPPVTKPPAATGVTKYPAPTALKASSVGISSVLLSWTDVPTKPTASSYTIAVYDKAGHLASQTTASAPDMPGAHTQVTVGGLKTKTAYHANVWANGGKQAPPHATVTFTTH